MDSGSATLFLDPESAALSTRARSCGLGLHLLRYESNDLRLSKSFRVACLFVDNMYLLGKVRVKLFWELVFSLAVD